MPRSAASDLGLHCLPMSHKFDARFYGLRGCVGKAIQRNITKDTLIDASVII